MYTPSLYHRVLRTSAVVTTLILAFESGVVVPRTAVFSLATEQYLANVVSMTASVAPNEVNTLAADLKKKSDELNAREREINARAQDTTIVSTSSFTYVLIAILVGQTVLILLNYFFDYRRGKRRQIQTQPVSS
jgi:hypothetical protein